MGLSTSIDRPAMPPRPETSTPIQPSILYFGTPVALISTMDAQGRVNLTPMSSAWALGDRLALGLGKHSQGCENLPGPVSA